MSKMSRGELRKYLNHMEKKELVNEVLKLVSKFDAVKQYYTAELAPDTSGIVQTYKDKIRRQYFPTRGFRPPSAAAIRKLISDFKKISVFDYDVIDVLLYRVEQGIAFSDTYGGIDEPFYASLESSYREALKLISKNERIDEFKPRCREIARLAYHTGWGFYDVLCQYFEEAFNERV